MPFIEDGTGTGRKVGINSKNQLLVFSVGITELQQATNDGNAYVWDYPGYDYDAADTVMYLRNNNPNQELVIDHIRLYSDTATKVQVHVPSKPTEAGTSVTGSNLNRKSGNTALAAAYQDETGNTQGTIILSDYVAANGNIELLDSEGAEVILGYDDCIAIDLVTAGTMAYGRIIGYFR